MTIDKTVKLSGYLGDITWPHGGYEFFLRVLKVSLASERSEQVRYFRHEKI